MYISLFLKMDFPDQQRFMRAPFDIQGAWNTGTKLATRPPGQLSFEMVRKMTILAILDHFGQALLFKKMGYFEILVKSLAWKFFEKEKQKQKQKLHPQEAAKFFWPTLKFNGER